MAYRGKSLKALRESKRIRLRRISNETRIGMAYLKDLEDERFDRFPGEFYFQSFTKAYAQSLGLNPEDVLADMQSGYEEWHGGAKAVSADGSTHRVEDGILTRIAGYLSGVQEV